MKQNNMCKTPRRFHDAALAILVSFCFLACQANTTEKSSVEPAVDICMCLTEPGNSAFMKENKDACQAAISDAIGVEDWTKVNFSKDPAANAKFETLSRRCQSEVNQESENKDQEVANVDLPIVRAKGGFGRSVDFSRFDPEDEETYPESEAASYFINGCEGGSIAPEARKASSVLPNWKDKTYMPSNMLDREPRSAWVEGKPDYGIGEWFEIYSNNLNTIYNGYQSSPDQWANNSRVKRFKVYLDGQPLCFLDLTDEMGSQSFELPFQSTWDKGHVFRFEIVDVYKGKKWADVCISEIGVQGCCVLTQDIGGIASNGWRISSVDGLSPSNRATGPVSVRSTTQRLHFTIWEIFADGKSIHISPEHRMYVKGHGFIPMVQLCDILRCDPQDIPAKEVELLMSDGSGGVCYKKIDRLEIQKGEFRTTAIRSLEKGEQFMINGFVQKAY